MSDSSVDDALHRAHDLEEAGDLIGAIEALSDAIELAPQNPKLYALRGRLLHMRKRWRAAIRDYDSALAIKPTAPSTLYLRAGARAFIGDFDGALADFNRCIELQPQAADAFDEIGSIHHFRGNLGDAIQAYRRAAEIEPHRAMVLEELIDELEWKLKGGIPGNVADDAIRKADALEEAKDLAGAIDVLSAAIVLAPQDPRLHAIRGRLFDGQRQWAEAIQDFDSAISLDPNPPATRFFRRGQSRTMVGDLQGALQDFERCAELQPRSADAYCEIGHIHYYKGRLVEAKAAFERALELMPERYADEKVLLATINAKLEGTT